MPMAGFPDFDACVLQMKKDGKDDASASRICGAIKAKVEGHTLLEGLQEDEKKIVAECTKDVEVFDAGTENIEDVEIFKIGTWNGDKYSGSDIDSIVSNFNKLKEKVKPPVKLGHDEHQDLLKKEGLPAAGWISKLKRVGNVIVATLSDVPKKVADLIKRRAYKRVSAEVYPEYISGGRKYSPVLRAVALLGQDIPAVESLADVEALYTKDKEINSAWYSFTLDELKGGDKLDKMGDTMEVDKLEYESLKKDYDSLKTSYAELETKVKSLAEEDTDKVIADLKAEIEDLKAKLGDKGKEADMMSKDAEASKAEVTKMKEAQKELDINTFIAKAKAEGKILPKQEALVKTFMKSLDSTKVVKYTKDNKESEVSIEALVREFIEGLPNVVKFAEISGDGKTVNLKETYTDNQGREFKVADAELAVKAEVYSKEHNVPIDVAVTEVSRQSK